MARAGFYAIGGYDISFRRDGRWYADEEPIANDRITLLFSKHVRPDGEGGWVIDVGIDRQGVEVEDTPLVVVAVEGDARNGFRVRTNDDVCDELAYHTLRIGDGNVLYCVVDRGERGVMPARFLRPSYYHLMEHVEVSAGRAVLRVGDRRHPIGDAGD